MTLLILSLLAAAPVAKPLPTISAALALTPAPATAKDRCLPRFSVVLFDQSGIARFRLHADYGGTSSFSLLGDKCVGLDFTFDDSTQAFVPTWRNAKGCKG